eukprot:GHVN01078922.1.p1 GENE.GHVN01078922.1~~GHVN01078922.1.p1  ORF type:complete len:262 (-),score=76.77 GHVN01078922.1:765-1451(-)
MANLSPNTTLHRTRDERGSGGQCEVRAGAEVDDPLEEPLHSFRLPHSPQSSELWSWTVIPPPEQQDRLVKTVSEMRRMVSVPEELSEVGWSNSCAQSAAKASADCSRRGKLFSSHCKGMGQCLSSRIIQGIGKMRDLRTCQELDEEMWTATLKQWFDERVNYATESFDTNPGVVGNFTQLCWYRTRFVGLALSYLFCAGTLSVFVVANFSPPGTLPTSLRQPQFQCAF